MKINKIFVDSLIIACCGAKILRPRNVCDLLMFTHIPTGANVPTIMQARGVTWRYPRVDKIWAHRRHRGNHRGSPKVHCPRVKVPPAIAASRVKILRDLNDRLFIYMLLQVSLHFSHPNYQRTNKIPGNLSLKNSEGAENHFDLYLYWKPS